MAMRPQDRYKSTTAGAVSANRNYKDTVFRMLFSDKKNLLSLYNAVNSRDYTNPDDLEIVTLENAIYMGMKNDLAFIIDTNLYLLSLIHILMSQSMGILPSIVSRTHPPTA